MSGADPEDVVRRFLEAESRFEPSANLTVGRLHAIGLVEEEVNAAVEVSPQQTAVNVRSLTLREQSADRALIDLDAFVVHDVKTKHGGLTADFRFRGPVELTKTDDGWRIASVVVDGIGLPASAYEPFLEQDVAGCAVTLLARPTKRGTCVLARLTNESSHEVTVSELALSLPYFAVLAVRWGSVQIPAAIQPGESWAGAVGFAPVSFRKPVGARLVVDGEEVAMDFVPSPMRPWSRRARLRRIDLNSALIKGFLILGLLNAIATNWVGLGFLGIGLAIAGVAWGSRAAIFELAGFRSSGSLALALVGAVALVAGSDLMLTHGLGWIGSGAIVGTMLFAMHRGFAVAHYVRRQRSPRSSPRLRDS